MFKKLTLSAVRMQVFLIICIAFLLSGCSIDVPPESLEIGSVAPDFKLEEMSGKTINLKKDLNQNTTFLLFWSSSCGNCKETMAVLEEAYKKSKQDGFSVVAINVYQNKEAVAKFSKELGLTYPLLLDQKGIVAGVYEVYAIPVAFILDKSGKILYKFMGDMSKDMVEALIKEYWE